MQGLERDVKRLDLASTANSRGTLERESGIHVIWFVLWVKVEPFTDVFPDGLPTMIVSLEAIFLSTFVMISQNRSDVKRQVLADHPSRGAAESGAAEPRFDR
jgi:uncharacterized membrane protein